MQIETQKFDYSNLRKWGTLGFIGYILPSRHSKVVIAYLAAKRCDLAAVECFVSTIANPSRNIRESHISELAHIDNNRSTDA